MDANFAFPSQSPPAARPRPPKHGANSNGPRESNALRASVLDVALELGIGNNSVVADWMFSNTVQEEDEEPVPSPGLTHSSSTTSTDEYSSSPRIPPTPPNTYTPINSYGTNPHTGKPIAGWNSITRGPDSKAPYPPNNNTYSPISIIPTTGKPLQGWNASNLTADTDVPYFPSSAKTGQSSAAAPVAFPSYQDIPIPPRPVTPDNSKRLKKKRAGGDGADSDGGYISDSARKRPPLGDLTKKESKARLKEEKREQKEQEKEERKRLKSLGALSKSKKHSEQDSTGGGYDTDGAAISTSKIPFRSKTKKTKGKSPSSEAVGYETDAGYHSAGSALKKGKSRFFGLGSKSSKHDLREAHQSSEPPQIPAMPLPIASKFATSLDVALGSPTSPGLKVDFAQFEPSVSPIIPSATPSFNAVSPTTDTDPFPAPPTTSTSTTVRPPLPSFSDETAPPRESPSLSSSLRRLDTEHTSITPSSPNNNNIHDRSSLSSAETSTTASSSSMSNNSRRRGLQFSPSREFANSSIDHTGTTIINHGAAASVSSTVSSVNRSSLSHGHNPMTAAQTASASTAPRSPASPPTSFGHLGPSGLKAPSISLPNTNIQRSVPILNGLSPVAPLQINKHHHPKLPHLEVNTRGQSPLPLSNPNSPFMVPSPSSNASSPAISHSARAISPIPPPAGRPSPSVRPLNPPTGGFGPQAASRGMAAGLVSPPPVATGRLSPNPLRGGRRMSPLNTTRLSTEGDDNFLYADHSTGNSNLPSPNVLAYYDIPPPSPPPMCPLPSVPPVPPSSSLSSSTSSSHLPVLNGSSSSSSSGVGGIAGHLPNGAATQLRNRVMERQKLVPELSSVIQRGKESPFPTKPVAASQRSPLPYAFPTRRGADGSPVYQHQQQQDANGVKRVRLQAQHDAEEASAGERSSWDDCSISDGMSGLAYDRDSVVETRRDEADGIQEVIERFAAVDVASGPIPSSGSVGNGTLGEDEDEGRDGAFASATASASTDTALPRHRSFEALREKHESFTVDDYYGGLGSARETDRYAWDDDDDDERARNRESRWSGSIYSRVSIMDPDSSEDARDRFVARVEAMMAASNGGGGQGADVPPVPKIPEGLANSGAWNRF